MNRDEASDLIESPRAVRVVIALLEPLTEGGEEVARPLVDAIGTIQGDDTDD